MAAVRLTPEEREAIARDLGRLFVWLCRWLGVPWWGTTLLLAVTGAALGAVYAFRKRIGGWLKQ